MHPSYYRAYPLIGDWDNLIIQQATNHTSEQESQVSFHLKLNSQSPFFYEYTIHIPFLIFDNLISMKILTWNVQGIGNKHTRQHLKDCIFNYNPDIIFLSETKNKAVNTHKYLVPMGYPNLVYKDTIEKAGGIAFMWKDGLEL